MEKLAFFSQYSYYSLFITVIVYYVEQYIFNSIPKVSLFQVGLIHVIWNKNGLCRHWKLDKWMITRNEVINVRLTINSVQLFLIKMLLIKSTSNVCWIDAQIAISQRWSGFEPQIKLKWVIILLMRCNASEAPVSCFFSKWVTKETYLCTVDAINCKCSQAYMSNDKNSSINNNKIKT